MLQDSSELGSERNKGVFNTKKLYKRHFAEEYDLPGTGYRGSMPPGRYGAQHLWTIFTFQNCACAFAYSFSAMPDVTVIQC